MEIGQQLVKLLTKIQTTRFLVHGVYIKFCTYGTEQCLYEKATCILYNNVGYIGWLVLLHILPSGIYNGNAHPLPECRLAIQRAHWRATRPTAMKRSTCSLRKERHVGYMYKIYYKFYKKFHCVYS